VLGTLRRDQVGEKVIVVYTKTLRAEMVNWIITKTIFLASQVINMIRRFIYKASEIRSTRPFLPSLKIIFSTSCSRSPSWLTTTHRSPLSNNMIFAVHSCVSTSTRRIASSALTSSTPSNVRNPATIAVRFESKIKCLCTSKANRSNPPTPRDKCSSLGATSGMNEGIVCR
jgi:hypothetical protein